jgi:hypothetical protein
LALLSLLCRGEERLDWGEECFDIVEERFDAVEERFDGEVMLTQSL